LLNANKEQLALFWLRSWLTDKREYRKVSHHINRMSQVMSHDGSHNEYGKIVHRPCSSCISSIQELNENSIEFFLLA